MWIAIAQHPVRTCPCGPSVRAEARREPKPAGKHPVRNSETISNVKDCPRLYFLRIHAFCQHYFAKPSAALNDSWWSRLKERELCSLEKRGVRRIEASVSRPKAGRQALTLLNPQGSLEPLLLLP
jgi:hypothetical protein